MNAKSGQVKRKGLAAVEAESDSLMYGIRCFLLIFDRSVQSRRLVRTRIRSI